MKKCILYFCCLNFMLQACSESSLDKEPEIIDACSSAVVLNVSAKDSIAVERDAKNIIWQGIFNATQIELFYNIPIGSAGENETLQFILNKTDNCLEIERAYKFYDGADVDISAVTAVNFKQLFVQEWVKDEFFAGVFVYEDPHDKITYTKKVWVNLTVDTTKEQNSLDFNSCLGDKLPIAIDLDEDGTTDFELTYETTNDIGNNPRFTKYNLLLKSTDLDANQILSPQKNKAPYFVVFEPPFTSENTKQYFNGVRKDLDIFYEYESPYEIFNYFVSNRLTYYHTLTNETPDYFLVKLIRDNKDYFGWVNVSVNVQDCSIEVLQSYLSKSPNEIVRVD